MLQVVRRPEEVPDYDAYEVAGVNIPGKGRGDRISNGLAPLVGAVGWRRWLAPLVGAVGWRRWLAPLAGAVGGRRWQALFALPDLLIRDDDRELSASVAGPV